jgi:hypothetical protein
MALKRLLASASPALASGNVTKTFTETKAATEISAADDLAALRTMFLI